MPRALVVDTNVFLLANDNDGCQMVAQRACYSWDYMLVLDRGEGKIKAEYEAYADLYPESWLRVTVRELIERTPTQTADLAQNGPFPASIITLPCQLTPEEYGLMACRDQAEPYLFGVACNQSHTRLVIPADELRDDEPIKRCYRHDQHLNDVRKKFPNIKIVTTSDLGWLDEFADPAPETKEQLEAYLEHNRLDAHCAERGFLELKCPNVSNDGILKYKASNPKRKKGLVGEIMEAICAMSNSTNGYIFIGVKDNGEIYGVPLKFDGEPMNSWDELWRKVQEEIQNFWPLRPLLKPWWIPISEGFKVLALRVERQKGQPLSYDREVFIRSGTASVRWDGVQKRN